MNLCGYFWHNWICRKRHIRDKYVISAIVAGSVCYLKRQMLCDTYLKCLPQPEVCGKHEGFTQICFSGDT